MIHGYTKLILFITHTKIVSSSAMELHNSSLSRLLTCLKDLFYRVN